MTPRHTGGKEASPSPTTRFTCRIPLPGDGKLLKQYLSIIDESHALMIGIEE